MSVQMCADAPRVQKKEGDGFPRPRPTDGCELLGVVTGNQTQVHCKNSMCS